MRTKISFHRNENKYIKSLFGLLIMPFFLFIFFSFIKGVLGFFNQSYDFSRKSLSKYLIDTIDFNKHDIDNLAKIVRYGRHWDESCNEWRLLLLIIYFYGNFPNAKLRPYDDYKNMSTLNTYCGILSTCHNADWILCPGKSSQVRSKIMQSKQKFYNQLISL